MSHEEEESSPMDLNDNGTLAGIAGTGRFDLGTYFLAAPPAAPVANAYWVRFHGSTIGVALSLMKYAAERVAYADLGQLTEGEKTILMRHRANGQPIFSAGAAAPIQSREFLGARQAWLDLRVARGVLLDSQQADGFDWDVPEAVGSAFSAVSVWANRLFGERDGLEKTGLGDGSTMGYVMLAGERVTTRLLWECAAAIDAYLGIEQGDPAHLQGSAGAPLRALAKALELSQDHLVPALVTTLALIDFAVNPPVPPFLTNEEAKTLQWRDIYPPLRFARACNGVKKVGVLSRVPDDEELRIYLEHVRDAAGLPRTNGAGVFAGRSPHYDLAAPFVFGSVKPGSLDADYQAYIAWAQQRLWRLRDEHPAAIAYLGVHGREIKEAGGWFETPYFGSAQDVYRWSEDLPQGVAAQYGVSVALYQTLHDLVSNTGPLRRHFVPPASYPADFWDGIENSVKRSFGELPS
ncbi:hypothetical protein [Hamadaea tsunoensis]|uniref:hypothetical protein n=1 Tax=Hamadaea tsunoensis TaxID=53368 RepID=UPI00040E7ABD|nr:hypothetical protein [Hamadaea tsunoensis]